eukprot:Hpha_TRINITY_DN2859_c0_g1::TRINITY_DN2859_c0_g1_i1::g.171331::m.171331
MSVPPYGSPLAPPYGSHGSPAVRPVVSIQYGSPVPRPNLFSQSLPRGDIAGNGSRQRSLPSFYVGHGGSPEPPPANSPIALDSDSESDDSTGTRPGPLVDPRSPSAHPPEPVHETLLRKGREYLQRREALQEEARRAELNKLRAKPQISRYASQKNPSAPIVQRCLSHAADRQWELDQARAAAIDAEEAQLQAFTFHPQITRRGRNATGRAHSVGAGDRRRIAKRKEEEKGPSAEDLAECNFAPQINKRSVLLAERQRKRLGVPRESGPHYTHADSLWERDHIARLRTAAKIMEDHGKNCPFSPEISKRGSASPPRTQHWSTSPSRKPAGGSRTPRSRYGTRGSGPGTQVPSPAPGTQVPSPAPGNGDNVRLSPPRTRAPRQSPGRHPSPGRNTVSPGRPWHADPTIPPRNDPLSPQEAAALLSAELGWR